MNFKCVDCKKKVTPQSDLTGMSYLAGLNINIPYRVCDKCLKRRMDRFPDVYWQSCHLDEMQQFKRTLNDMGYGEFKLIEGNKVVR